MGCFIACLGGSGCSSKKRKHLKSSRTPLPPRNDAGMGSYQQLESVSVKLDAREGDSDLKKEKEKPTLRSVLGAKKKVSFNLNVRTYELISSKDYSDCEEDEKPNKNEKVGDRGIEKESASAYPSNYRYKNFIDFEEDDEEEDEEEGYDDCLEDCLGDDNDHEIYHSIDGKAAIGMCDDEGVTNAHSVLSPVENTAQWRAVKVKKTLAQTAKHQCKENVALDDRIHTSMQQEIRVDASLSIWIGGNAHQHNLIKAL